VKKKNFIRDLIDKDLETSKFGDRVHTRFPPEPNGYLHIGHAKSICLNFGIAHDYKGPCNLRFDDTNPLKEEDEYIRAIRSDIKWLGFDWGERLYYASDYFDSLYDYAAELIRRGRAYVCDLSQEEVAEYRGTIKSAGRNSPCRDRSVEENLDLFERMKRGEFEEGEKTLRAKIDMASPHMLMRDPPLYRIRKAGHHRTGNKWCIYPMYDFAHCISDSIEGITHSICTLEFENNRPLYDWILDTLEIYHPRQIEFARLNLSHTVLSKRRLLELVEEGRVSGWDDPRMPTIAGLRKRGYTPASIRGFCRKIGVAKQNSTVEMVVLENSVREELNKSAQRIMAVLDPVKVVITNYPAGKTEECDFVNNPEDPSGGTRKVPFSREIYIEREDFREEPPKKFFRLAPGREVRLRYAYYIKCIDFVKDETTGEVKEIHCVYDPATKGGDSPDGRKVRSTLHWVSAGHSVRSVVRLYDTLFLKRNPEEGSADFKTNLNPDSVRIMEGCMIDRGILELMGLERFQFERKGYFFIDPKDSTSELPVFNRIVSLRDTWARMERAKGRDRNA